MKSRKLNSRAQSTAPLGDIISQVLKVQNLEVPLLEKRAEEAWPVVAGAAFLKYTTSVLAKKGVLYISLSSSVVRNELMMAKKHIIKQINKEAGGEVISDIVFR